MNKKKRLLPLLPFLTVVFLFLLSLLCHVIAFQSRSFADFFNSTIAAFLRAVLALLTGFLPFSLAEVLLLMLPVLLFLFFFFSVRVVMRKSSFRRFVAATLSIPMSIYILFVGTYATGYQMTPLADRLAFEEAPINKDTLLTVATWAGSEAASLAGRFPTGKMGESQMPYSWGEMTEKLNDSYQSLSEKIPLLQNHRTAVKPIMLSRPMTYTGIVGVYTFFTGESNVNTTFPDYSTVFTAAHEMAHQRGIAPEDEANFIAFLVLISSNDDYLRYVGYLNLLDYLESAIYKTDADAYKEVVLLYTAPMRAERAAYSKIYRELHSEPVRNFTDAVNDAYLKGQGTEGKISYSLVVTLAVRYYYSVEAEKQP